MSPATTPSTTPSLSPRPRHVDPVPLAAVAAMLGLDPPAGRVEVTGVSLDSRRVEAGDLYAALPGEHVHGAEFVEAARAAGAVAVLTDDAGARMCGTSVPALVVARPREHLGEVAALVYGRPADDLCVVGVTGTQGKTTTAHLAAAGIEGAGRRPGLVGTVGTLVGHIPVRSVLTTPEAPDLHALFAVMRERAVDLCAMEVSSHALVQGRVDGVVFDVAGFTNLGRDHLDFHRDVEDYYAAKASLFTSRRARRGVVMVDDPYGRRLADSAPIPVATMSAAGRPADWRAVDVRPQLGGTDFVVEGPDRLRVPARVPMPGGFNVANALAAIAMLVTAGLPAEQVADGVARSAGVPGRMERVDAGQPFLAVVDYAHKPDAVRAALDALRPVTSGRLIVVLGAGGDRDPGKRPLMGRVAAERADVVIVTDDNPRSEDPATIRAAVLTGARAAGHARVEEVGDRAAAVRAAVALAGDDDTVLVAGKGHETGQEVAGVVHPFDDRAVLAEAVRER